jgi:HEPN domain-containing protein
VDRKDLQELSRVRLKEAKALLTLGLHDGAYYLAGYAVECALKACIARQTQRHEFPDNNKVRKSWTHALNDLVNVAGLKDELQERTKRDFDFRTNWDIAASWSEESRYRRHRPESAHELVKAVDERRHGVIAWIRLHW